MRENPIISGFCRCLILMAGMLALTLVAAAPANAQVTGLTLNTSLDCDANGNPTGGTTLFSHRSGGPSACGTGFTFARFFCMFEGTLGIAAAKMMCRLQKAWVGPLAGLMMLAMTLTGVMFVTGLLNMTARELVVLVIKMGLITTFALNTPIALEIAYTFFIGVASNTVSMVESLFSPLPSPQNPNPPPPTYFQEPDKIVGATELWAGVKASAGSCPGMLTLVLIVVVVLAPIIAGPVFLALMAYFLVFARAAAGYAYSLTSITFLLAAMPIFLSFALFTSTKELFDDWLRQMGEGAIQIFIIFLFLAFMESVDMFRFLKDLGNIVTSYPAVFFHLGPFNTLPIGFDMCTLCGPLEQVFEKTASGLVQVKPGATCAGLDPIPITDLLTNRAFLTFIAIHVAALYILSEILDKLLVQAPHFATSLAGQRYAYNMGADSRAVSPLVGGKLQENVMAGARQGWRESRYSLRKGLVIGNALNAVKEGALAGIYGQRQATSRQLASEKKRRNQALARIEERKLTLQNQYTKYATMQQSRRQMSQRGLDSQRGKFQAAQGRQRSARIRQESLNSLNNMIQNSKGRGIGAMELSSIRRREASTSREIEALARQMQGHDTASREYAEMAQQRLELQQRLREMQKHEEYIRNWGKNGIDEEQVRQIRRDLAAADRELERADREVVLQQGSLQRAERIDQLRYAQDDLILAHMQKGLRDNESDKQKTEADWKRIRQARGGGGIMDDVFNPEIEDMQGKAQRASDKYGLDRYDEDDQRHKDLLNKKRREEKMQQQLWYGILKD